MNILCLTSWGMGVCVEFQLYIVSNKPFPHQARLAKASTLKQHISASSMEQSWSSRNIHSARPFQTQQKTTPARTNESGFSPAKFHGVSRSFTAKKRRSRQVHGIFTLFPCRFPIAKPMINVSRNPTKLKTLSIDQLQHVYMVFARLWKAYFSATSTAKPCGY